MGKINPWARPRPTYPTETREFDCGGGEVLRICLRAPDPVTATQGASAAQTTLDQLRQDDGRLLIPTPEGLEELAEPIVMAAAMIEAMQIGEERYTIPELLGVALRLPEVWADLNAFALEMIGRRPERAEGNAPGAATKLPS